MTLTSDYSILDHLLEGCQIIGYDWRYLFINAAAEKHNHRPKEELLGKKYMDMWPGIEATEVFVIIRRCLEERMAHQMEDEFVFPDGTKEWFNLSIQPIPEGVFILSIDLTEWKRMEKELITANEELVYQNEEKEKRAAELVIANEELVYQNEEKEKRAAELIIANEELVYQNEEKEKRAAELIIANEELAFQNKEKEKRAAELIIANEELVYQNEEKEKRAAELVVANEETVRRLQNIQALHKIDQAIAGSLDLNLTLHVVLDQTKTELNVDAAAVLLFNPHAQVLEFAAGIGFRSKTIERSRLRLGEGHGGRAALERRTVSATNLLENSTQFDRAPLLVDEGFATYFGTPLIAKGQVNGVLEVFHRLPFSPDENWLELFKILAEQTAIAVDSAHLFTELKRSNVQLLVTYDSTIEGWSHALDLRDKETEGHTQRVTEMTLKLARAAGMTEAELVHVRRGALLHDIGKMGVPDHILLKPDKLTDEEWVAMRKHPTFAFELLSPIAYLRPALDIPYCHHEKWDGSGYPRGLKGEQIPLAARLFAIIDVWDALLSDRPYRQGWPEEKVIEHIKSLSGTHFDPKAVELFLKVIYNEDPPGAD
ncbi:MAG: HD domain-containing phosphohydrolase [Bellilinea sp.]